MKQIQTKKRRRFYKKKKKSTFIFFRIFIILSLFFIFILFSIFFVWVYSLKIPDVQNFENRKISNSTKIYDKTGKILLYDIHKDIRRTTIDIDEIASSARYAIIAIEDHNFYNHNGVVWKSTLRAIFQTLLYKMDIRKGGTVGGSTITQQVVKNTLLNREKAISRKVKEWVLAYKIEKHLTKNEILEVYLNEAPYGGTVYGIEEASIHFFGISASELSIAQSAYLAAIPNLPTYYSPYGPNKEKLDQRQGIVLSQMKIYGFISDKQYKKAILEKVEFIPEKNNFAKSLHFVQYVRAQLEEIYGVDVVQNGGLRVITTLDYELQKKAEEIIKKHIEEVEEKFNASNAGLIAIESSTGHILVMVGSRDYFDTSKFDGNFNITLANRQPGSAFKPIAYATAFERGYFPESSVFDTQTQFNSSCEKDDFTDKEGCYSPNNYDFKFKGPISFRNALAQSRNIPSIKVSYLAGLSNILEKAQDFGITSLTKSQNHYGLGLVLGGGEVSLLELTGAYTVFANDGIYNKPTAILEVINANGKILEKYTNNEEQVLTSNVTRMINSILSDNKARAPLFGSQSFLYFGDRDVAGKTGTTNDNRDAWLISYIPQVAVGVWTGNNDNSPMKKGSSISGKPWRNFMDEIIKNYKNESFENYTLPENIYEFPNMVRGDWFGGTTIYIDSVSGKRATEFTPEETKIAVPQPDPHTILHWIDKLNPSKYNNNQNDSQYENWEYGVQEYSKKYLTSLLNINIEIPDEYDDIHTKENSEPFSFKITGVDSKNIYSPHEVISLDIKSSDRDKNEITLVQYFINNAFISSDRFFPFGVHIIPGDLQYIENKNIIKVIVTDEHGISSTQETSFLLDDS